MKEGLGGFALTVSGTGFQDTLSVCLWWPRNEQLHSATSSHHDGLLALPQSTTEPTED